MYYKLTLILTTVFIILPCNLLAFKNKDNNKSNIEVPEYREIEEEDLKIISSGLRRRYGMDGPYHNENLLQHEEKVSAVDKSLELFSLPGFTHTPPYSEYEAQEQAKEDFLYALSNLTPQELKEVFTKQAAIDPNSVEAAKAALVYYIIQTESINARVPTSIFQIEDEEEKNNIPDEESIAYLQSYLDDFKDNYEEDNLLVYKLHLGLADATAVYGSHEISSYVFEHESIFHVLAFATNEAKSKGFNNSFIKKSNLGIEKTIELFDINTVLKRLNEEPLKTILNAYIYMEIQSNLNNISSLFFDSGVEVGIQLFGKKKVINEFIKRPQKASLIYYSLYLAQMSDYYVKKKKRIIFRGQKKAISLFGISKVKNILTPTLKEKALIMAYAIGLGVSRNKSDTQLLDIKRSFSAALDIYPTDTLKHLLFTRPKLAERYAVIAKVARSKIGHDGNRLYSDIQIRNYLASKRPIKELELSLGIANE